MRYFNLALLFCFLGMVSPALAQNGASTRPQAKMRIVLVGDSTVGVSSGWGPGFMTFLTPDVECTNAALNGRSSKTFRDEGHWEPVLKIKPDYVLIQFGHNDQPGKGPALESPAATDFRANLRRYVNEARAAGIKPVLITSLTRRRWNAAGKIESNLIEYADATKAVAAEMNVPLLDLHARSIELCDSLGPEKFQEFEPLANGAYDHTHLNPAGSKLIGKLVAGELRKIVPALAEFIALPAEKTSAKNESPDKAAPLTLKLWEGDPPKFVKDAAPERDDGTGRIWNVSVPGMLVYLPADSKPTDRRTAIIICPGGSYTHLTRLVGADGTVDALGSKGIVIISLKYRLKPASKDVEADALLDAHRAVRLARFHAAEWGIDPGKIGVLGWSAGGNLGLNIASHFDRGNPAAADPVEKRSSRPDFVTLLSPWPDQHDLSVYPIAKDAPPAFICSAKDDRTAPVTFAQAIAASYDKAGASAEIWVIESGGHGAFELGGPGEGPTWPSRYLPWLKKIGMYN